MKYFLTLALVAASMAANAASYISVNDTVRIDPNKLDGYQKLDYTAQFDGYCDAWSLSMDYPEGLTPKLVAGIVPLEGMTVSYTNRFGETVTQEAPLQVSAAYATISSSLSGEGYWDWDSGGYLESYGSVKWEPGTLEMFSMNYYVSPEFRRGTLTITGHMTSGSDKRGAILADYYFAKQIYVYVGNIRGDVDSNNRVTISDVTVLIEYLLSGRNGLNWYEKDAADVNCDGTVAINDVTALINLLLTSTSL